MCINFNYYLLFILHAFTCTVVYFILFTLKKKQKRITLYARIRAPTHTRAPTAYAAYAPRSREYLLWPATPRLTV